MTHKLKTLIGLEKRAFFKYIFELRGMAPQETASFVFWGTLRVPEKQNSLFPVGPVIKCLLYIRYIQMCI